MPHPVVEECRRHVTKSVWFLHPVVEECRRHVTKSAWFLHPVVEGCRRHVTKPGPQASGLRDFALLPLPGRAARSLRISISRLRRDQPCTRFSNAKASLTDSNSA